MDNHKKLVKEYNDAMKEAKRFRIGSAEYSAAITKVRKIGDKLIIIESSLGRFNGNCMKGNYTNNLKDKPSFLWRIARAVRLLFRYRTNR